MYFVWYSVHVCTAYKIEWREERGSCEGEDLPTPLLPPPKAPCGQKHCKCVGYVDALLPKVTIVRLRGFTESVEKVTK